MNPANVEPASSQSDAEVCRSKVLVVDDHPILRLGLMRVINQEHDMMVCAEAGDAPQALEAIESYAPDMAIVDISLPGLSGLGLLKSIGPRFPDLRCLMLSTHDEAHYADRALRAGAKGYLMKHESVDCVILAIRKVLRGEMYLSDKMSGQWLPNSNTGSRQDGSPIESLSDRELEVYRLIGNGLGTREIAKLLHVAIKTVESHRATIKRKFAIHSSRDLVRKAIIWVQNQGFPPIVK